MPLLNTLRTHFLGPWAEIEALNLKIKLKLLMQLLAIARYLIIYNVWHIIIFHLHNFTNGKIFMWIIDTQIKIFLHIPIIGEFLARSLDKLLNYARTRLLPGMERIEQFLETIFQICLIEMTFRNENVKLIITGDKLHLVGPDKKPTTSLIVANHRSIMDYTLLNLLTQVYNHEPLSTRQYLLDSMSGIYTSFLPSLKFISWGKISNVPTLSLIGSVLLKDENTSIPPSRIKRFLEFHGNQVLVVFPEVNVITPEIRLIQRKITEDYHSPKFQNLLYPRFKTFVASMKCFAYLQNVKRTRKGHLYVKKVITKLDRIVNDSGKKSEDSNDREITKLKMFLGHDFCNDTVREVEDKLNEPTISFDQFIWDITILYFQPKLVRGEQEAHLCPSEPPQQNCHYRLEQITPSFMQLLTSRYRKVPIIIRVDIKKHSLGKIIALKDRKLEKWLEGLWCEKDKTITEIEQKIKLT